MFDYELVVVVRVPRDLLGWSNWQQMCDQVDAALLRFAQTLISQERSRERIDLVTSICYSGRAFRRGRILFGPLIDLMQMCRFASNTVATEAEQASDEADTARLELELLSGVHPAHPLFAKVRERTAAAELLRERARRYGRAADLLLTCAQGVAL
ncbi:MAG: hypothetical protein U0136_12795 [Bdellovibrionota bacterium]